MTLSFRISRSLEVTGTDTDRSDTCDFLLVINSNRGFVSYRFRNTRRFRSKIANFSHPRAFENMPRGFPGNFVMAAGLKKTTYSDALIMRSKKIDDTRVCLNTISQRDVGLQTDGRTEMLKQYRAAYSRTR